MSVDNSHRQFILLGSTLIERILRLRKCDLAGCQLEEFKARPRHPRNLAIGERINRLHGIISEFVSQDEAQEELVRGCMGILNASRILVDEIVTVNVSQLIQRYCPGSLMLDFFDHSMIRTLGLIEYLISMAIAGHRCECLDCDGCSQRLREEFSDVLAVHNSVRLYLLVTFIQSNYSCLPRHLVIEMVTYAQINYASHCPEIYREALNALKLGYKVLFPLSIHLLEL